MFCPKCGNMLLPKDGKMVCPNHGPVDIKVRISEISTKKVKEIKVAKEESDSNPIVAADCPKCGNRKAYSWMVQTRSADEAPTRFHKCTKCGHQWKEYS